MVDADFCNVQRVSRFNLMPHQDTSDTHYKGQHISLNLVARSCAPLSKRGRVKMVEGKEVVYDEYDFYMEHGAV